MDTDAVEAQASSRQTSQTTCSTSSRGATQGRAELRSGVDRPAPPAGCGPRHVSPGAAGGRRSVRRQPGDEVVGPRNEQVWKGAGRERVGEGLAVPHRGDPPCAPEPRAALLGPAPCGSSVSTAIPASCQVSQPSDSEERTGGWRPRVPRGGVLERVGPAVVDLPGAAQHRGQRRSTARRSRGAGPRRRAAARTSVPAPSGRGRAPPLAGLEGRSMPPPRDARRVDDAVHRAEARLGARQRPSSHPREGRSRPRTGLRTSASGCLQALPPRGSGGSWRRPPVGSRATPPHPSRGSRPDAGDEHEARPDGQGKVPREQRGRCPPGRP